MAFVLPTDVLDTCSGGLLYCFSKWAYDVTGGIFWTFLLLGFCIVLMMATFRFGVARSFGFASVVGLFGAIFLATLQLMPWWVATVFILSGAIGFAVMIMNNR